jgi:hypothetical protein
MKKELEERVWRKKKKRKGRKRKAGGRKINGGTGREERKNGI